MAVLLELETLPTQGAVSLRIDYSFNIKVTAHQAQRQVDRWLLNEVSYLMGAGEPMLVVAHQVVWRVPVYLSTPDLGQLGPLAQVQVTVDNGMLEISTQLKTEIWQQAEKWLKTLPPYHPYKSVLPEYHDSQMSAAPRLMVTEQGEVVPRRVKAA